MRRSLEEVRGARSGTSLVEVMCAVVLLALMALACGSYIEHSRADVANQRYKRLAVELACNRLEEIRGSIYDTVRPVASNYNWHFLARSPSNTWSVMDNDPREIVVTNSRAFPIATLVRYEDVDGWAASYDYVRIRVRVTHRAGTSDDVVLETCHAP